MSWVRNPLAAPITPPLPGVLCRSHACAGGEPGVPGLKISAKPSPVAPPRIFAGTSGWAYPTWKPGFYPEGTSARKMLPYYASQLNSVEINHSFRKLPTPKQTADWLAASAPDLRLSFKAPQRITHFSRLRDCEAHVAQFLAALKPVAASGRLGLILFQLPPNFKADAARLADFLALPGLSGRSAPRIAFEFRHESWFTDVIYTTLSDHGAALCLAENDEFQTPEVHTAKEFTAFRLRRAGGYKPRQIKAFAERFLALAKDPQQPREVFAYFKHEEEPTGALKAVALLKAVRKLQATA